MRIILFKAADSEHFERYVDINFPDKFNDELIVPTGDYKLYNCWYNSFLNEEIAIQMATFNYFLLEYCILSDAFEKKYGRILFDILYENIFILEEFNSKWIYREQGAEDLDINWGEKIEEIHARTAINPECIEIMEFKDGSIIKFPKGDDTFQAVYFEENNYYILLDELKTILELFNNTSRLNSKMNGTFELDTKIEIAKELKHELAVKTQLESQIMVHITYKVTNLLNKLRFSQNTYLRCNRSGQKSKLLFAENMAIFPNWTFIIPHQQYDCTLVFENLGKECTSFNLIEDGADNKPHLFQNIEKNKDGVYYINFV